MNKYKKNEEILNAGDPIYTKDYIIYNPSKEDYINNGYVEYITKLSLDEVKENKIQEIRSYDISSEVNEFYLNNIPLWLEPDKRQDIIRFLEGTQLVNNLSEDDIIEYSYNGIPITIKIKDLKQLVFSIDYYAGVCMNITNNHISNIRGLLTIEDVNNYNYRTNYPEKLKFNI